VRRKIKGNIEIEENRDLIDKNSYEDQLGSSLLNILLRFYFGARKGRASKGRKRKAKQSKDQARKSRIKQLQQEYLQVTYCMCDFLACFDMHGFTCWCMVLLLLVAWFFRVMTMVFSLTLLFSR